jgi:hypothetical protein
MKSPMLNVQPVLALLNNMILNSTELTFKITIEEANLILAGLQELPAKASNPLTAKIQQQAREQLAEPDTPETEQ